MSIVGRGPSCAAPMPGHVVGINARRATGYARWPDSVFALDLQAGYQAYFATMPPLSPLIEWRYPPCVFTGRDPPNMPNVVVLDGWCYECCLSGPQMLLLALANTEALVVLSGFELSGEYARQWPVWHAVLSFIQAHGLGDRVLRHKSMGGRLQEVLPAWS